MRYEDFTKNSDHWSQRHLFLVIFPATPPFFFDLCQFTFTINWRGNWRKAGKNKFQPRGNSTVERKWKDKERNLDTVSIFTNNGGSLFQVKKVKKAFRRRHFFFLTREMTRTWFVVLFFYFWSSCHSLWVKRLIWRTISIIVDVALKRVIILWTLRIEALTIHFSNRLICRMCAGSMNVMMDPPKQCLNHGRNAKVTL